jgi:hypothetical protein
MGAREPLPFRPLRRPKAPTIQGLPGGMVLTETTAPAQLIDQIRSIWDLAPILGSQVSQFGTRYR